jgi:hypothetical protein
MENEKDILEDIKDTEWIDVLKELIHSGVTKEEFKQFLEVKRMEKNLSK